MNLFRPHDNQPARKSLNRPVDPEVIAKLDQYGAKPPSSMTKPGDVVRQPEPDSLDLYDFASESSHLKQPCTMGEVSRFLKTLTANTLPAQLDLQELGPRVAQALAQIPVEKYPELFREGAALLDRTSLDLVAVPAPFVALRDMESEAALLAKIAARLDSVHEACASIFVAPSESIVSVFVQEVFRRLQGVRIGTANGESVTDKVDRARITLIRATGVGLKEEDTAFGALAALGPESAPEKEEEELNAEQRIAKKKASLMTGSESYQKAKEAEKDPEASKSETVGSFFDDLKQSTIEETKSRLEDCKPQATFQNCRRLRPVRNLNLDTSARDLDPRFDTEEPRHRSEQEVKQELVYQAARSMCDWMMLELATKDSTSLTNAPARFLTDRNQVRARAEALQQALNSHLTPLRRCEVILRTALSPLCERLYTTPEAVSTLNEAERLQVRKLGAKGLGQIVHAEQVIPTEHALKSNSERHARQASLSPIEEKRYRDWKRRPHGAGPGEEQPS